MKRALLLLLLITSIEAACETFEIFHTNDLHGALEGIEDDLPLGSVFGGAARLVTALSKLSEAKRGVLWLDAGDFNGSSSFSLMESGHASWQQLGDFAKLIPHLRPLVALGNHDMEGGVPRLNTYLSKTEDIGFDVLAANLFLPTCGGNDDKSLPPSGAQVATDVGLSEVMGLLKSLNRLKSSPNKDRYQSISDFRKAEPLSKLCESHGNFEALGRVFRPYKIIERAGFRIGILGLTNAGMEFEGSFWPLKRKQPVPITQSLINELRSQKVDLIGVISHLGVKEDIRLIQSTSGIDFLISGHDHRVFPKGLWITQKKSEGESEVKTFLTQLGRGGAYLGRITFEKTEGKTSLSDYEVFPLDSRWLENSVGKRASSIVQDASRNVDQTLENASRLIGESLVTMPWLRNRECLIDDFVSDAFFDFAKSRTKLRPISLGFQEFNERNIKIGKLYFRDAFDLIPRIDFVTGEPSEVWLVTLDGYNLANLVQIAKLSKKWLEVAGGQLILAHQSNTFTLDSLQVATHELGAVAYEDIQENEEYVWSTFSLVVRMLPVLTEKIKQLGGAELIRPIKIEKTGVSVTQMMNNYIQKQSPLRASRITQGRMRFRGIGAPVLLESDQDRPEVLSVTLANLGEKNVGGCALDVFGVLNPDEPLNRRYSDKPLHSLHDLDLTGDPLLRKAPHTQTVQVSLPHDPNLRQVEVRLQCPALHDSAQPNLRTLRIDVVRP